MKSFLTFVLLFSSLLSSAADSTFNWVAWKKTWPKEPLVLKPSSSATGADFNQLIEVIDMRSDTSCLGLDVSRDALPYCIVVENGLSNWINLNLPSNQVTDRLLLVAKSLWINEFNSFFYKDLNGQIHTGDNPDPKKIKFGLLTKLTCKVDVFFRSQDNYQPLVRLDTILLLADKAYSNKEQLAADFLAILRTKISEAIRLERYKIKTAVTKPIIIDSYNKIFQVPILKDSVIRNGFYYSWEQFKQNRPDTITYSIQYLKSDQPSLFVKNSNGLEAIMQEGFALRNENKLYRLEQGAVFEMYRDENAFYSMRVSKAKVGKQYLPLSIPLPGATIGGSESLGMSVKFKMSPYLLNPETGEEY